MKNKLIWTVFYLVLQLSIFAHGDEEKIKKVAPVEVKKEITVKSKDNTIIKEIYIEVEKKGTNKRIIVLMILVNILTLLIATDEIINTRKKIALSA